MNKIDFGAVNATIARDSEHYLSQWLPGGRIQGQEYVCGSLEGGPGESCSTNLKTGTGCDFAGDQGWHDFVDLYARIHGLKQGAAAMELQKQLGISNIPSGKEKRQDSFKVIMPCNDAPIPPDEHPVLGTPTAKWIYQDREGLPLFYICRFNKKKMNEKGKLEKEFRPLFWTTQGWKWQGMPESNRPLYGLESLRDEGTVLLTEGEKAADAARRLVGDTFSVLSWPNGTKSIGKVDFTPIRERKVIFWPDADKPGLEAARVLADKLETLSCDFHVITPPEGISESWDAADAEEQGWRREDVLTTLVEKASAFIDKDIVSLREVFETEYNRDPLIENFIDKGESLLIYAQSGFGKSLLGLQLACELAQKQPENKEKDFNDIMFMGKFRIPKQRKVLFIQSENSAALTNSRIKKMVKGYPAYQTALDNIMFMKYQFTDDIRAIGTVTDKEFLDKIEKKIKKYNIEVFVIDPLISFIDCDENANREMRMNLDRLTLLQIRTGASCVIIHHASEKSARLDPRGATSIFGWPAGMLGFERNNDYRQQRVFDVKIPKVRSYPEMFPFKVIRDDCLICRAMPEDTKSGKEREENQQVLTALKSLGGHADTASDLINAVKNIAGVEERKAKEMISTAFDASAILKRKEGRVVSYVLPDAEDEKGPSGEEI